MVIISRGIPHEIVIQNQIQYKIVPLISRGKHRHSGA